MGETLKRKIGIYSRAGVLQIYLKISNFAIPHWLKKKIAKPMHCDPNDKEYSSKFTTKLRSSNKKQGKDIQKKKRYTENQLFNRNQKKFYRELETKQTSVTVPTEAEMHQFWFFIWPSPVEHDEKAYRVKQEQQICAIVAEMLTFTSTHLAKRSMKYSRIPLENRIVLPWEEQST